MLKKTSYTLVFSGIPPAKKNNKRTIYRGGRKYVVPSENHEQWHNRCQSELWEQKQQMPREPIQYADLIVATFYVPDLKKRDSDNCLTSILDFLVDMDILVGDHMQIIREERSIYAGVDAENPRTEIVIHT